MKNTLERLEDLYSRLCDFMPKFEGNICGTCHECCRAEVIGKHQVSAVELDLMVSFIGEEEVEKFKGFISRERDGGGGYRFSICPFYQGGCTIYPVRPFSCRFFGPFRIKGTPFPPECNYEGKEREIEERDLAGEIPLWKEFQDLKREHLGHLPLHYSSESKEFGVSTPEKEDVLDFVGVSKLPKKSDPPHVKARYYHNLGLLPRAMEEYRKALEVNPDDAYAHFYLGTIHQEKEEYEKALRHLQTAFSLLPSQPIFAYRLALAHDLVGQRGKALSLYLTAISLNPENSMAHGNVAFLKLENGEFQDSLVYFGRAVTMDPRNVFFHIGAAQAMIKLGFLVSAEEELLKARTLDPACSSIHLFLAEIYRRREEYQKALQEMEKGRLLQSATA